MLDLKSPAQKGCFSTVISLDKFAIVRNSFPERVPSRMNSRSPKSRKRSTKYSKLSEKAKAYRPESKFMKMFWPPDNLRKVDFKGGERVPNP